MLITLRAYRVKREARFNFYAYERHFMHCLYFICERKFYARTHVKIMRHWKSTLSSHALAKLSPFGAFPLRFVCVPFINMHKGRVHDVSYCCNLEKNAFLHTN